MRIRISYFIVFGGVGVICAGVLLYPFDSVTFKDAAASSDPLIRIPLGEMDKNGSVVRSFSIPDDESWRRLFRRWGQPTFIIVALSPRDIVYDTVSLDLDFALRSRNQPVKLQLAGPPYGYSSECQVCGFGFAETPGTTLTIQIRKAANGPLPEGDIIVVAWWPYQKDLLVREDVDRMLRWVAIVAFVAGGLFVSGGAWIHRREMAAWRHAPKGRVFIG